MVWRRFDENGRVNYESYMDHAGILSANVYGVYQVSYDYDEDGRKIRETYFDAEGQPMVSNEGYLAKEWSYDAEGNATESCIEP